MGKPTGFLEQARETAKKRPVADRVRDYGEVETVLAEGPVAKMSGGMMLGVAGVTLVVMIALTSLMFRKSKPPAPKSPAASMETLKA